MRHIILTVKYVISEEIIRTSGEILKYTVLLFITIPFGVKTNHKAIITPQNKKLIIKNAAVFLTKPLNPLNLKLIRQMSAETISFTKRLNAPFIGGRRMMSEHNAPNDAPKINLNCRDLRFNSLETESRMK